jgi:hypothetical protein
MYVLGISCFVLVCWDFNSCHSYVFFFHSVLSTDICNHVYSRAKIIEQEQKILETLNYKITVPTAHAFLVILLKVDRADKTISMFLIACVAFAHANCSSRWTHSYFSTIPTTAQLSCYILDSTLQSNQLLTYTPSQLASAAVSIARQTAGHSSWSPALLQFTNYCEDEVAPVARAVLSEKLSTSPKFCAVVKKHSSFNASGHFQLD